MTLQEFLLTASPDHGTALQQAHDYVIYEPVFITSNTLTVYVVGAGLYDVFTDVSKDPLSPVRGICLALMDRLRGQSEFNLSASLPLGRANIEMLDSLIAALPLHKQKIIALKETLLSISNRALQPFSNATLHDVLVIREACPVKPVSSVNGWITITTTTDVPPHSARVYGINPRTGHVDVLGDVRLSDVRTYEFKIPTHYLNHTDLIVDDAYGSI